MSDRAKVLEMAVVLARKFVAKCDTGQARSVETQADCREFLTAYDDIRATMKPGVGESGGEWPQWIRDAASEIMGPENDLELRRESHRTKLNIEQLKASQDREWAAIADVIKKHSPPAPELAVMSEEYISQIASRLWDRYAHDHTQGVHLFSYTEIVNALKAAVPFAPATPELPWPEGSIVGSGDKSPKSYYDTWEGKPWYQVHSDDGDLIGEAQGCCAEFLIAAVLNAHQAQKGKK